MLHFINLSHSISSYLSIYLSLSLFLYLPTSLSLSLSPSLSLSLSLSIELSYLPLTHSQLYFPPLYLLASQTYLEYFITFIFYLYSLSFILLGTQSSNKIRFLARGKYHFKNHSTGIEGTFIKFQ